MYGDMLMKNICMLFVILVLSLCTVVNTQAQEIEKEYSEQNTEDMADGVEISAPSAILMEMYSGQVIYEKEADIKRAPASVTKVMTLLLIFDALEEGKIKLEDEVTVSEYAASMGGSQVFLEPGEVQTADTMIKCISVASANDACVAMAERIYGSEAEFVSRMNERAEKLGMKNTNFVNCNGLDAEGHETTARDIALMSRELMTKYPQIRDYCKIWQENIIHTTKKGSTKFGLTNTNKLVRHYKYATGLKTGSTSKAKFCISATGEKDGIEMIAVIMAADDSKKRNADAVTLLNYGFSKCQKYEEDAVEETPAVKVKGGEDKEVKTVQEKAFSYIDTSGADLSGIERKTEMKDSLEAPVEQGTKAGEIVYYLGDNEIGRVNIMTVEEVKKATYKNRLRDAIEDYCL